MVNASDSSRFMSKEELQNSVLLQLKTKAAKVGANGLIIKNTGSEEVAGNPYANFSKWTSEAQFLDGGDGAMVLRIAP